MAKKDNDSVDEVNEDGLQEEKESAGGKILTILIVLIIIIIWVAVFGVLIKLNIGNFGSDVLYPVLKDVPVLNNILPDLDEDYAGKYDYATVADAVIRIKELEKQLDSAKETNKADGKEINNLKAEVARLKKFEEAQENFSKRVAEFDEKVVFNEKAPELTEYKSFYEQIEPDNAEKIYKKVIENVHYSQKIKNMADIYSKMEPAQAAAVFETMTGDLNLLAQILDNMSQSKSSLILQNMSAESAAQITKKMTAKTNK